MRSREVTAPFGVLLAALCCSVLAPVAVAGEVRVAVAANFRETLRTLEPLFSQSTGHTIAATSGSTGLLYAQIRNGAPFDVLLAADDERPVLLARDGFGTSADVLDGASAVFTYAVGRLVLWSAEADLIEDSTLNGIASDDFRWFAIAEPATAPYGAAAQQVLERLGIWELLQPRIVRGTNIAQTFAMIETGNAELGLVAMSQALAYRGSASWSIVPQAMHDPIAQDAIVLARASGNPAALAFVAFLRSPEAVQLIERHGYSVPPAHP